MPELPEVETVVRQLRPGLIGRTVRSITLHTPTLMRCQAVPTARLVGSVIRDLRRRGKFIRCDLTGPGGRDSSRLTILVHLRMTGRLTLFNRPPRRERHDHIDLLLDRGRVLRFRDMRKFGGWWLLTGDQADREPPLSELGPEPLEISRQAFRRLLAERRQAVKALMLNQRRLAGMGNIYCDESLFAAGIHPEARACDLSLAKADALWRHMRRILRSAIRRQGSTISDFTRPDGQGGRYQDRFQVYGRSGEACVRCGTALTRLVVAGRGTTVCRACQTRT